jgi:hypothetical protein
MAQGGGWGNGGGWGGQGGGGPPGQPPGGPGQPGGHGGYGQPPAGGYGQPPAGGYGQPPAGPPPGGYGQPPAGPPPGGYGQPPAGPPPGGYGQPPPGGPSGPPPGAPPGGGFGAPPGGGNYGFPPPPGGGGGGGGFGFGPGPAPGGYGAPPPGGYGAPPLAQKAGVAWESRSQSFFGRWYATVRATTMEPRAFFSLASASEDPMPSVMFSAANGLIVGLGFGIFVAIAYVAMGAMGALSEVASGGRGGAGAGMAIGIFTAMGLFAAVIYPVMFAFSGFINPWIQGGITHLSLALLGGTKRPYQSTVRVAAYAHGPMALMLIPCVGFLLAPIAQMIALVVGVDETHQCGLGKALFAVLLFPTICCILYVVFVVIMSAVGALAN